MVREAKEVANTASRSGELTLALSVHSRCRHKLPSVWRELKMNCGWWVVGGGEGMHDEGMRMSIYFFLMTFYNSDLKRNSKF